MPQRTSSPPAAAAAAAAASWVAAILGLKLQRHMAVYLKDRLLLPLLSRCCHLRAMKRHCCYCW
jgi:hypothetical protein